MLESLIISGLVIVAVLAVVLTLGGLGVLWIVETLTDRKRGWDTVDEHAQEAFEMLDSDGVDSYAPAERDHHDR